MAQGRSIRKTCVAMAVAQAMTFSNSEAATFRVNIGFDSGHPEESVSWVAG